MDIEIIRREKNELQYKISTLIEEFEKKTSVQIDSLSLESTFRQVPEGATPILIQRKIVIDVKI